VWKWFQRKTRVDFFVSYSHTDAHLVEGLAKVLRLEGRNVFVDDDSIAPGEDWKKTLLRAIRDAKHLVLFWCCHSRASAG
jgi:hypothetical protein